MVKRLKDITISKLENLQKHDIVIVVADGLTQPTTYMMFDDAFLNASRYDPGHPRTMFVVTKVDSDITPGM